MNTERAIFYQKQDDLLSKFSPEFKEKIFTNPEARAIFEMLSRDHDVYKIIEQLIDSKQAICEELKQYIVNNLERRSVVVKDFCNGSTNLKTGCL